MIRVRMAIMIIATMCLPLIWGCGGQHADSDYDVRISSPAFTANHPKVLFDEAHDNSHRAGGTYRPYVKLIENDGCNVFVNRSEFTASRLAGYSVLVIANAKGPHGVKYAPAFTESEIAAIQGWVFNGGGLLLIMDKEPFSTSVKGLAAQFGVKVSEGSGVEVTALADPASDDPSQLVFSRGNQSLADHPISRGRNSSEYVRRVMTFTGAALTADQDSASVLRLIPPATERPIVPGSQQTIRSWYGDVSYRRTLDDAQPVSGNSQLVALEFGKGRVVISGEAAMLSAQKQKGQIFGMNVPGTDNRQFALNIIHWLTKILN